MIKKYNQFIKESFGGFGTIGEYIESLSEDNDYALNIISQYTKEVDPTVRIANAINILDNNTQKFILKMILDNKKGIENTKDVDVIAYTDANMLETEQVMAGKNLFKCYLKVFTSLGFKNTEVSWENTPDDFLIYLSTPSTDVNKVKLVMSRYKYFNDYINSVDYIHNECSLFYGVKCDGTFQYGICSETQIIPIGTFKLTKGILNWILVLDSPSASRLKRSLISLDINKISLLCKIKREMKKFIPGSSEKKSKPVISNDIITFGYYGIGKWDNDKIDSGEMENIKTNFKNFLVQFSWSDKIQVSITSNDNWVYLNIKLK